MGGGLALTCQAKEGGRKKKSGYKVLSLNKAHLFAPKKGEKKKGEKKSPLL